MSNVETTEKLIEIKFKRLYKRGDIVKDIKTIFSCPNLTREAKAAILLDFCWSLTERNEPVVKDGTYKPAPKAKIKGCDYWSEKAFELAYKSDNGYNSDNGDYLVYDSASRKYKSEKGSYLKANNKYFDEGKMVTHEHLIPKKILIDALLKNTSYTITNLEKFLEYFKACVITKDEDRQIKNYKSSMTHGYSTFEEICDKNESDCIWERYKEEPLSIIIYKVKWGIKGRGWVPVAISDIIEIKEKKIEHFDDQKRAKHLQDEGLFKLNERCN